MYKMEQTSEEREKKLKSEAVDGRRLMNTTV